MVSRPCKRFDLEIVYKNVEEIYSVTDEGDPKELKETYGDLSEFANYYCRNCGEGWVEDLYRTQSEAWQLAKEHLA